MTEDTPKRWTILQRWHRLRTSPRFPYLVFVGLLVVGALSQVYAYWWSIRIEEMLERNKGSCERIAVYPYWMRKHLGQPFVRRLEPIRQVSLRMVSGANRQSRNDDLRLLRGAPFLTELNIGGQLSPHDVWYLKWLRGLKTVRFYDSSEAVVDAAEWMPSLSNLTMIFHRQIPLSTFERIARLPRLERLACYFNGDSRQMPEIARAYAELRRAGRLKRLELTVHNGEQLAALVGPLPDGSPPFPELRELRIAGSRGIEPADLGQLINLPSLIHLELSYSNLTNAHLPHLKQLPFLRTLYVEANPHITDEGVAAIASMTQLQTLNIKGTNISADGLRRLAKLPRLRCLRAHMGLEARNELRKLLPPRCELDTN